jgi:hypothetical protein
MSTITSTATMMVNAAFLQEVKDSHLQFWSDLDDLKHLLASDSEPREQSIQLVRILNDLRDSIALEFSLEDTYGYIQGSRFANYVAAARATQARRQHGELYLQLHEILERAEEAQYRGTISRDYAEFVTACEEFLDAMQAHEELESDLIRQGFGIARFGR